MNKENKTNKDNKEEIKKVKEEDTIETRCPACNASIKYNPKLSKFKCDYCGGEFTLEEVKAANEEKKENKKEDNYDGYVSYKCESCGAEIITDEETSSTFCVYCGNTAILKNKLTGKFAPDKIIPFTTTSDEAKKAFKELGVGRPLVPKDFTGTENIEKIKGVYIPFWLYDLEVSGDAEFTGKVVTHWSSGRTHYTKTDTYRVLRSGSMDFYDIPIDGSTRFDNAIMNSIEPFKYEELVDYDHAYLSGFYAEKYDTEGEELFTEVSERAKKSTIKSLEDTAKGYTTVTPVNSDLTSAQKGRRYALLPVWMLNVKYKDKMYTFAMNGQTGKFIGNIPIDVNRAIIRALIIFVIGIIIFIFASYLIYFMGE